MCLNVKIPSNIVHHDKQTIIDACKQIATQNITVYKRLRYKEWANQYGSGLKLWSPYQNFIYELGHNYQNVGLEKFTFILGKTYLEVHEGLHAYTDKDDAFNQKKWGEVIVKCIIPKGSKYFINEWDGEIVSNKLNLKKIICK